MSKESNKFYQSSMKQFRDIFRCNVIKIEIKRFIYLYR